MGADMIVLLLYLAYAVVLSIALGRAGYRESRDREAAPAAGGAGDIESVLIVGATGGTGRHLVAHALARGYRVTALVRDPAAWAVEDPLLTVVQGDVLDEAAVDRAVTGQDAVLSALGHKRWLGPSRILSGGTRNLLQAMAQHGARRLVVETALGVGSSAGRMGLYYTFFVLPVLLPFYFWDKARQERIVAASPVEWVLVRPGALNNRRARGRVRHGRVGSFLWTVRVSREDTAVFMLDQLTSDRYLRAAPGVSW